MFASQLEIQSLLGSSLLNHIFGEDAQIVRTPSILFLTDLICREPAVLSLGINEIHVRLVNLQILMYKTSTAVQYMSQLFQA